MTPTRYTRERTEARFRLIFATIIVLATLASARSHERAPAALLEILLTVTMTLFVVHTFADYLARRFEIDHAPRPSEVLALMAEEVPLLIAGVVPVALYALAALGLIREGAAYTGAAGYGVALLFATGYAATRPQPRHQRVLSALIFAGMGLFVIWLEASLH